jgi:hypothetical protein
MGKKLYIGSYHAEVAILADSVEEAYDVAEYEVENSELREGLMIREALRPGAKVLIPSGYTMQSLVYHAGEEDISLADAVQIDKETREEEGQAI